MDVFILVATIGFLFQIISCQEINDNGQITVSEILALGTAIPGIPEDDYPIYSQPPETSFSCSGQVNGGYYADTEARCQSFHICAGEGRLDGLTKFSFLCPNGTLFQQQYFVCDWWFNVDCSKTEEFYGLNGELQAAREAATFSTSERRARDSTRVLDDETENKRIKKETSYNKLGNSVGNNGLSKFKGLSYQAYPVFKDPEKQITEGDPLSPQFDITHLLYGAPTKSEKKKDYQMYSFNPENLPEYSLPFRDLEFGYTNVAKEVKSPLSPQDLLERLVSMADSGDEQI